MSRLVVALLLVLCVPGLSAQTAKRTVFPANAPKPVGPYSPGVVAGDYVYVAGQGVRPPTGDQASDFDSQARQCFENIRAIVSAAGLSMRDVVYMQAHVLRHDQLPAVEKLYRQYFPSAPPARSTVVVELMPTSTPVEINAIAYARRAQPIRSAGYDEAGWQTPAIVAGDRIYLSGTSGATVTEALKKFGRIAQSAGASLDRVGYLHIYLSGNLTASQAEAELTRAWTGPNRPAVTYASVLGLPRAAQVQITGVAVKPGADFQSHRSPSGSTSCVSLAGAVYCSLQNPGPDGSSKGTIEQQTEQVFTNVRSALQPTGVILDDVVAATVYLHDLADFQRMNAVYGKQYQAGRPARTTLQPAPKAPGQADALLRIAVIAEK